MDSDELIDGSEDDTCEDCGADGAGHIGGGIFLCPVCFEGYLEN